MADQFIALDEPAVIDKKLDSSELTVGANTVQRERLNIADPTAAAGIASVLNAAPSTEYGLVTRNIPSGTQTVSGTVTANIGTSGSLALDATLSGAIKAEDAAHTSGDNGIMALAVRKATNADLSAGATDGDYEPLEVDAAGRLWVHVGTVDGGTIGTITNVVHVDDNAGSLTVDGTVGVSGTVTVDSELTTADLDTGAGTDTKAVVGVVVAASGGSVNLSGNSGTKDNGTIRVVLATDQPQLTNKLLVTPDANSAINLAQLAGNTISSGNGTAGTGTVRVAIASDNTANSNPFLVSEQAATSGGVTPALNSIKATATSIKASAGQVYGWYIYNSNSSAVYVQFFNTASGSVTLGTTVPTYSLGIPATSAANAFIPCGIVHGTAITIAATTTSTGSTAPTNNVDINVFYK